jgi:hypothetical protein
MAVAGGRVVVTVVVVTMVVTEVKTRLVVVREVIVAVGVARLRQEHACEMMAGALERR